MRKIKSFTVAELTVAMLLGSIVIGVSYQVLTEFNSRFGQIFSRSNDLSHYRLLEKIIGQDMCRAFAVMERDNSPVFYLPDQEIVQYRLERGGIVRDNGQDKTIFLIKCKPIKFSRCDGCTSLVNEVLIPVDLQGRELSIRLFKSYTPVELLEAEKLIYEWPAN